MDSALSRDSNWQALCQPLSMQPVHPPIALSFKELSPDRTRSLISAKMIPHESISTFLYEEDGAPEKFFYENDSPNVRWKQKGRKVAKRTKGLDFCLFCNFSPFLFPF
jgi:hypothetical protein